ncbi:MAG: TraR/DksA family transcriptional regulator [Syntrophorhabdaceae bacterium]
MLDPKFVAGLKDKLTTERDRIFAEHDELRNDRQELLEREVEFEENAQKDSILEPASTVDEIIKVQLDAVNKALKKMDIGDYGICEKCGREIEAKRLAALPWATLCLSCMAGTSGRTADISDDDLSASLPPDLEGLSDEEIVRYVYDEIARDGRVDIDEVSIGSSKGILHIDGVLPSEAERQILIELLLDGIGFEDIIDHISINPLPWESAERASGRRDKDIEEEEVPSDEDETEDAYSSRTSGAPLAPPDELVPEDRRKK